MEPTTAGPWIEFHEDDENDSECIGARDARDAHTGHSP